MNSSKARQSLAIGFPPSLRWSQLVVFGVCLVIGWQLINGWIWIPSTTAWQRQASLKRQIADADFELQRVRSTEAYLASETALSLTDDASEGAHRYQAWLLKRTAEVPGISVMTSPVVSEGGLGALARFEIGGEADLGWLTTFVEELSATPLQHRITYLKLDEPHLTSVQFKCALEALFLEGAVSKPKWPLAVRGEEVPSLLSTVLERKPFSRGYNGPPPEPQLVAHIEPKLKEVSEPPVDPLATLKLVGLVSVDGKPQAWMVDSRTNQQLHVSQTAKFAFADQAMQLIEIERDAIEILCGTSRIRWPLGSTLRSVLND